MLFDRFDSAPEDIEDGLDRRGCSTAGSTLAAASAGDGRARPSPATSGAPAGAGTPDRGRRLLDIGRLALRRRECEEAVALRADDQQ